MSFIVAGVISAVVVVLLIIIVIVIVMTIVLYRAKRSNLNTLKLINKLYCHNIDKGIHEQDNGSTRSKSNKVLKDS